MKLINIIENLSDHYSYKIGINGNYQGTFNKDKLTYDMLKLNVYKIYPMYYETDKSLYLCLDLTTEDLKE